VITPFTPTGFKKKGDILKAKEQLTRAIGLFKECSADGWVEKYEKEPATLVVPQHHLSA